jgi:hypothetical protein
VHRLGRAPFEQLEGAGVLRVDGHDTPSTPLPGRTGELPACDEALLVRKRQIDPALERPEGRGQSREADDRIEDHVRLGTLEQLREVAAHLRQRREAVDALRARSRRHELELGVRGDDLQGLIADRPGRSEERDTFHAGQSRSGLGRGS